MKDIKIRYQERVELKNHKRENGMYCICGDYTDDMKEVAELLKKIDERIDGEYEYLNDTIFDYYSSCKDLKYWEIYNENTENKDDKYLINFYLYDLENKCRVAENEFWITMSQAKEEDRRLI